MWKVLIPRKLLNKSFRISTFLCIWSAILVVILVKRT
jgi:hypothetical protein